MTKRQTELRQMAEAWAAVDPDPETRARTLELLRSDDALLEQHFGHPLTFGTAGIRGALGPGPARMNRVLVRRIATALGRRVLEDGERGHVVIGFDARHMSRDFAEDTARVLAGMGVRCTIFADTVPTPVLAFAVKHLDASAGVMVTASHNPRNDNGYKVYWRGGVQITAPIDAEIAALMADAALPVEADLVPLDDAAITTADPAVVDAYIDAVVGLLTPDGPRGVRVAYTPLHGVGGDVVQRAFAAAGFEAPMVVADQAEPDPDFPTAAFPNPEETGVLDRLLRLAAEGGADVALANDPDADRLSVAVPSGPLWRLLTGDEVGCILASYLLERSTAEPGESLVVNTVVSSRLLGEMASAHGVDHVQTLTGFKWIMGARAAHRDHRFVMGYEEALGYSVGDVVGDKDGVGAALMMAEVVAAAIADDSSVLDRLDELHRRHGVHVTGQRSLVFEPVDLGGPSIPQVMAMLRRIGPDALDGGVVRNVIDLAHGYAGLPSTDGLILEVDHGRFVVRPSGTEPKIKVYGEVWSDPGAELDSKTVECRARLEALTGELARTVADLERRQPAFATDSGRADLAGRAEALVSQVSSGVGRVDDLGLIVRCIDLTTLEGDDTAGRVRALCAQARRPDPADPTIGPAAAVCVYPAMVATAAEVLRGTGVAVASVAAAFPSGLSTLDVRLADIRAALDAGATEIDVVLNRSAFLSGHTDVAEAELQAFRAAVGDAHMKVIIETGELGTPAAIRAAAELAIACGADTIKTSTGKSGVNATPVSVLVMAEAIADHHRATGHAVGLKVSGGVRTAADALGYVALVRSVLGEEWMTPERFRFGASSLLSDVVRELVVTRTTLRSE